MQPNLEALRQVVRVLENLPEEKFNMNYVMRIASDEEINLGCGTVGCAIGWAAEDPWFTQRGFVMPQLSAFVFSEEIRKFFFLESRDVARLFYSAGYRSVPWQRPQITRQEVINKLNQFITAHGPKIITNT